MPLTPRISPSGALAPSILTPSPYTVSFRSGEARFTSIQAAIDQALADGANPYEPAEIFIYPGFYTGNLTASVGGIFLTSLGGDYPHTRIQGSITFTNSEPLLTAWGFHGLEVSGLVSILGAHTSNEYGVLVNNCNFFSGLDFESCQGLWLHIKNGTEIRRGAARAINFGVGTPLRIRVIGSTIGFGTALTATHLFPAATRLIGSLIYGGVIVGGTSGLITRCTIYADGVNNIRDETTTASELMGNMLWANAAGIPVINHTGAGQLTQMGNFWGDSATAPYIVNSGGPVLTGGLVPAP